MYISDEVGYSIVNAELNYNNITDIEIKFCNKANELAGKMVYIDDISVYTNFVKLVRSRAQRWQGQIFE